LTSGLGWRSIFWFLTIVSGIIWLFFLFFFRDTFRKERSLTYQNIVKQRSESKRTVRGGEAVPLSVITPSGVHQGSDPEEAKDCPTVPVDPFEVELSLRDVNPVKPIGLVIRRINNIAILIASGR